MKGFQKFFILWVAVLFLSSAIAVGIENQNNDSVYNLNEITLDFKFTTPLINQIVEGNIFYHSISMDDLPKTCSLNKPRLPVKTVKILLPYGQTAEEIEVIAKDKFSLGSGYNVEKGHNIIPLDKSTKSSEYSRFETGFFENTYSLAGTHFFRGYMILIVNLYPVQYCMETGEILWYKEFTLKVSTRELSTKVVIRESQKDKDMVSFLVDNPSCIATYDDAPMVTTNRETIEYIIITSEGLRDGLGDYTFHDLIQAKIDNGMSADIVTVEDIIANPDYWVNGDWGDNNPDNPFYNGTISGNIEKFNDTQAIIRNFIRYAYTQLGTEYILLGGDADYSTSENIVPVRELYAVEDGLPLGSRDLVEEDIPSDVYYACLDGNFNWDEDEHWGENATQNDVDPLDEADLFSEVFVGRACVDADDEVSNFVMKTLAYEESDSDPYIFTGLMVGEYLGFPGVSTYGGNYKDLIIPFFPEEYFVDTLYDRDGTWSKYDLMNILNSDTPHLINHLGHGNVQYGLKMDINDISSLTNDKYFFIYSQTCLAGSFDNSGSDCAAEYFTVETPHAAFAVIMNARYGLGSEDTLVSPSQVVDESFFKALFNLSLRALGQANHYAKEDHVWHINENGIRWVYYETNLFGDPALRIKPNSEPPEIPEKPDGPTEGLIDEVYTFGTSTTDPDGDNIYYQFDWGDNSTSNWLGPYESGASVQAEHQWKVAEEYEIRIRAKDDNNSAETDWSYPLIIKIFVGPVLDIGCIFGGFFKVNAEITNRGDLDSKDLELDVTLGGGMIILGKTSSGELPSIAPGEKAEFISSPIFGFGSITITFIAENADGVSDTREQEGFVYLFFIKVKPSGN